MSFFARFGKDQAKPRIFVLGLDGVPHSFLLAEFAAGRLPRLRELADTGRLARMTSVIPTISSVAWSTYMTGKNPGKHGIYGFVDRKAGSYDVFVPTGLNLAGPALWEVLGDAGFKVIVMNVPVTYPPRPVNGILVSDFLCTSIDKVAYPPAISARLKELGYRIDADAKLARTSREAFLADVDLTLEKRFEAAFRLMEEHPWDFFQLHVMETDRINHFVWPSAQPPRQPQSEIGAEGGAGDDDPALPPFRAFYRRLDELVGETVRRLPRGTRLVLLSDHGFCAVKKEVALNQHLVDRGLLRLPEGQGPAHLLAETTAYSLIPGRIYLNLRGREPRGSVDPARYVEVREAVAREVMALADPDDGSPVIREVIPGERLYQGGAWSSFPAGMGGSGVYPPDLVAVPVDGYDLKGGVGRGIFSRTELTGMHTYDDAFLLAAGPGTPIPGVPSIADVMPSILRLAGVPAPPGLDGRSLEL